MFYEIFIDINLFCRVCSCIVDRYNEQYGKDENLLKTLVNFNEYARRDFILDHDQCCREIFKTEPTTDVYNKYLKK